MHWVRGSVIAMEWELYKAMRNSRKDVVLVFRLHEGALRLAKTTGRKNDKAKDGMVYTIPNVQEATHKELCHAIQEFCRKEPQFVNGKA